MYNNKARIVWGCKIRHSETKKMKWQTKQNPQWLDVMWRNMLLEIWIFFFFFLFFFVFSYCLCVCVCAHSGPWSMTAPNFKVLLNGTVKNHQCACSILACFQQFPWLQSDKDIWWPLFTLIFPNWRLAAP